MKMKSGPSCTMKLSPSSRGGNRFFKRSATGEETQMQKLIVASASGFKRLFLKATLNGVAAALLMSLGAPTVLAQNKSGVDPASYTGTDREQRLAEGARKEGALTIY